MNCLMVATAAVSSVVRVNIASSGISKDLSYSESVYEDSPDGI